MVKAQARLPDGRIMLVLGLSEGNVTRLKAGQPIYFDAATVRIGPTDALGGITVFYGADERELARTLKTLIGPETEVITVPDAPKQAQ